MTNLLLIATTLLITFQAFGQTRPGSGPTGEELTIEDDEYFITRGVNENAERCKTKQKFKNIIEIQTYISIKNVAADGKKDCSELKPQVSPEVVCLFKGAKVFLGEFLSRKEEKGISFLQHDFGLNKDEAKSVSQFYKNLDSYLQHK